MWFTPKIRPEKIKAKNTKELKAKGIEVIDHLPFLQHPEFREPKDIAKRMMILIALFQLYLGAPVEVIEKWINKNRLQEKMTEEEKQFLKADFEDLSEQNQTNIFWYIEAVWTFAWIGGLHNTLTLNTGVEDSLATMLPNIEKDESALTFINNYKLRSEYKIFDVLDKFYRAHWFARNNDLAGKASDKVDLDIIIERRKALEFVCYAKDSWDEISLDT